MAITVPRLRYVGTCPDCDAEHFASVDESPPTHCVRCPGVALVRADGNDE